jgi:hypothetical protein
VLSGSNISGHAVYIDNKLIVYSWESMGNQIGLLIRSER